MNNEELIKKIDALKDKPKEEREEFSPEKVREKLKSARHKADIPLTILAVLVTLGALALVSWVAVTARDNESALNTLVEVTGMGKDLVQAILRYGGDIAIAVILYLIAKITAANITFLGKMLSNEMRLTDSRFAYIKDYYRTRAEACGMKKIPELFITGTSYETEVMKVKVRSNKAITIDKKMLLKAEQTGDWQDVEYDVCKRLARIYLGYYDLANQVFTFTAKLIPGLKELLNRCRVYSTDRVVMALMGEEAAVESVFLQCYDSELYKDLDREAIVRRKLENHTRAEDLSKWLENAVSETPVSPYRLIAMLDTKTDGRLF